MLQRLRALTVRSVAATLPWEDVSARPANLGGVGLQNSRCAECSFIAFLYFFANGSEECISRASQRKGKVSTFLAA